MKDYQEQLRIKAETCEDLAGRFDASLARWWDEHADGFGDYDKAWGDAECRAIRANRDDYRAQARAYRDALEMLGEYQGR